MTWSNCGTIQLSNDWQYTEPINTGSYFRLKHREAPNGSLYAIAQCELDAEGNLSISDSQILAVEKSITDVVNLPKGALTDRRIAIKRIRSQPNLEQEIRRLFLPNFLMPIDQEINYIRRNNWQVDVEVSDYAEVTDVASRLGSIDTKLATIEGKVDRITYNGNGGTTPNTTSDPYFSSVRFLAHLDTEFVDIKGHTIIPFGNAQISTAQSKFSTGSAYFDGAGDYLQVNSTADFAIGSEFTIECFVRFNSIANAPHVFQLGSSVNNRCVVLLLDNRWYLYFASTNRLIDSGVSASVNTWYHAALVSAAGTTKLYVDRVNILSTTDTLPSGNLGLHLGHQAFGTNINDCLNGYINEVRITQGIARDITNSTLLNQPFPNN